VYGGADRETGRADYVVMLLTVHAAIERHIGLLHAIRSDEQHMHAYETNTRETLSTKTPSHAGKSVEKLRGSVENVHVDSGDVVGNGRWVYSDAGKHDDVRTKMHSNMRTSVNAYGRAEACESLTHTSSYRVDTHRSQRQTHAHMCICPAIDLLKAVTVDIFACIQRVYAMYDDAQAQASALECLRRFQRQTHPLLEPTHTPTHTRTHTHTHTHTHT
jgi:hypothetical protein